MINPSRQSKSPSTNRIKNLTEPGRVVCQSHEDDLKRQRNAYLILLIGFGVICFIGIGTAFYLGFLWGSTC